MNHINIVVDLSHKFIKTLKKRVYGWVAGNEAEGDYGDWEDWRKALVEFENKCQMSKWVLVKDKLPENRVGKIVYCKDETITTMYYDPEKKYWVTQTGSQRYDILAWMDKPKPPKLR